MNSSRNPPTFPFRYIWDEFGPDEVIDWEALKLNSESLHIHSFRSKQDPLSLAGTSEEGLRALATEVLQKEPSNLLVENLCLVALWLAAARFRIRTRAHLKSQRTALRELEIAARNLAQATERISAEIEAWIPWLHGREPERLLSEQEPLSVDLLRRGAHDLALVAASVYSGTRPEPGRRPETRRDSAIILSAEAVEKETGSPITWSRGTDATPSPHFTNDGGRLLREFFKLIDHHIDERVIVQSLERLKNQA